jgi:hypothetical protein
MGRLSSAGSMQWASDITAAVQAAGGMTSLWAGGPGSTFGTVAWSTMVDSFAAQAALTETLAGDALFQALVAQANNHIEDLEADVLMQKGALAGPDFAADILGTLFYRSFFGNQLRPGSPAMGATVASAMFLIILLGVLVYTFVWQRRVTTYEL